MGDNLLFNPSANNIEQGTHHEQISSGHPDGTDIREGFHDVIEGRGGESVHGLTGVSRDTLVNHLQEKQHTLSTTCCFQPTKR